MPQPLLRVLSSASRQAISFNLDALTHREKLASEIAISINLWSQVEAIAAQTMAVLMGAKAELVIAIHTALSGAAAQNSVFDAVAREHLTAPDFDLYLAIKGEHKSAKDIRNDLAHGLWGVSTEIPDGVLWLPMAAKLRGEASLTGGIARVLEATEAATVDAWKAPEVFALNDVFVYRAADFQSIHTQLRALYDYWQNFKTMFFMSSIVVPSPELLEKEVLRLRNWLGNERALRDRLEILRKSRMNLSAH